MPTCIRQNVARYEWRWVGGGGGGGGTCVVKGRGCLWSGVGVGRGGEGECEISHYICREYSERLTAVWACLNELQDLQFTWESIRMGKHYQKTTTTTHTHTHARTHARTG